MKRWLLCTALIGCASTKPEAAVDETQATVEGRLARRVVWNAGTDDDARAEDVVRDLLARELDADAAVQIALLRNPELQAQYEDLGIAQADLVQAGLLKNIHVGGGPRFSTTGAFGWEGDVAWSFVDALLVPLRKKVAKAELHRATLEVTHAVLSLDAQVRNALWDVIAAEVGVELQRDIAASTEAAAELARSMNEAGTLNDLERAEIEADDAHARMELLTAHLELNEKRETVHRLLGLVGHETQWKAPRALPRLPSREADLDALEQIAIAQRLDLASQRAQLAGLERAVKLARRTPFVDIELGVAGERDPGDQGTLGPFLELEIPIFDWGQAASARAEALLRQSEWRLRATALRVRYEVRVARTNMLGERQLAEYARDIVVPLREKAVDLAKERYDAMLLGAFELLDRRRETLHARLELVERLRQYWHARTDLELAIGGRLEPSLARAQAQRPAAKEPTP